VHQAADIAVRVRASPHWSIATDGFAACVARSSDGWTVVRADEAGHVEVEQSLTDDGCSH
jgi:hypothetical protein